MSLQVMLKTKRPSLTSRTPGSKISPKPKGRLSMSQNEEKKVMSKATGKVKFFNSEHLEELRKEMEGETSRGSAVLGHAHLEDLLGKLLIKRFVKGEEIRDKIKYRSFYHKTHWCYRLGLISETIKKELLVINKIRNAFAHKKEIKDFNQEDIPSKCEELVILKILEKETNTEYSQLPPEKKYHMTVNILWLLFEERLKKLTTIEEWVKPF